MRRLPDVDWETWFLNYRPHDVLDSDAHARGLATMAPLSAAGSYGSRPFLKRASKDEYVDERVAALYAEAAPQARGHLRPRPHEPRSHRRWTGLSPRVPTSTVRGMPRLDREACDAVPPSIRDQRSSRAATDASRATSAASVFR